MLFNEFHIVSYISHYDYSITKSGMHCQLLGINSCTLRNPIRMGSQRTFHLPCRILVALGGALKPLLALRFRGALNILRGLTPDKNSCLDPRTYAPKPKIITLRPYLRIPIILHTITHFPTLIY